MKKILLLIMCFVGVLSFISCSSDDDKETQAALALVKSEVKFSSNPSEGYIEYTSTSAVTATSSEEWCTASVSGNKVLVSVTGNTERESRNAVITLKSGDESVSVPVNQTGSKFRIKSDEAYIIEGPDPEVLSIKIDINVDYTVESSNWIHTNIENGVMTVTFDKNEGGYRAGYFTVKSELGEKYSLVCQLSANNGIDGYYAAYYKTSTSTTASWNGVLATFTMNEDGTGYDIDGVSPYGTLSLIYDSSVGYYTLANSQLMGIVGSYYIYNHLIAASGSSLYFFSATGALYSIYYDLAIEEDGTLAIYMSSATPIANYGYTPYGFDVYAYTAETISTANRLGRLSRYVYLQFYSYSTDDEDTNSTLIPSFKE